MGDTKAIPIQNGNGNGNGRAWQRVVEIVAPIILAASLAATSALAAKVYADSERIKACEVSSVAMDRITAEIKDDLREVNRKLDRLLERK